MAFPRRWFGIVLALVFCAGPVLAASSKKEQRAYDAAVTAFHDGMWNLAEMEFNQFVLAYPESTNVPEVWLLQAQAVFKQNRFAEVESFLTMHLPAAGSLTNAYTYWLGEAQFQNGEYASAAGTLASLGKDSNYALPAVVEAAAAWARLGKWPSLLELLDADQAVFDTAARQDPDNELVLRGRLLRAQAEYALGKFEAAGVALANFKPRRLPPDLEWQRVYLLCQVKLAAGDREAALPLSADLLKIAGLLPSGNAGTNYSASVALHATVLEGLGRNMEAVAAFRENLSTNVPEERQREAILKIAALSIAQGQYTNAEVMLDNYTTQFTNSTAADAALLALGELYLRDYAAQPVDTNVLAAARARFDLLLANYTNSPFAGKAYLDRGWCGWLATNYPASLADFQSAVRLLPHSEDLAVAQFKVGDVLFAQTNYAGALTNYQAVLGQFADFPKVAESLGDRALYQSLRAQLQLGDLPGASASMARLAAAYPTNELSETSALLLGESYTDLRDPAQALVLFQKFEDEAPNSPLRPSVELAIARAHEEEQNWPAAIAQYKNWLSAYPTNRLLSQAAYSLAEADYKAGDETNALTGFTNFVAQFPLDEQAPTAQFWVADHYFRLGEWNNAERKYKSVYQNTNWQGSALYYPAQMMAGRAAASWTAYAEAIGYFQDLENDTNCPLGLRVEAAFAHGSALMRMDSSDTNNPAMNYQAAAMVFSQIASAFPTNEWGARAWGQAGDCYLQLSQYDNATNAYAQVVNSPVANLAVRSQAQVCLGEVLEKKAALLPAGPDQTALLTQALGNYLSVFYGNNRSDNESEQDPFWTKKAGMDAAALVSALGQWQQATNIYYKLELLMPELKPSLQRKADAASQHLNVPAH